VMQCLACRTDNKMLLMDVVRDDTMKEPAIEHHSTGVRRADTSHGG
jgi:hypothetical protein